MSLPRLFLLISIFLFGTIGVLAVLKKSETDTKDVLKETRLTQSIFDATKVAQEEASSQKVDLSLLSAAQKTSKGMASRTIGQQALGNQVVCAKEDLPAEDNLSEDLKQSQSPLVIDHEDEGDAIAQLFSRGSDCPIVETLRYSSRPTWKPHKQAWLIDYASHYKTPIDFIIRSITGRIGMDAPAINEGQQFNVLKKDSSFYFYLVISFATKKLRLYYVLPQENKAVYLKSFPVCLGRKDATKTSGSLTPFGIFRLGSRVACFKPKMMGTYKGSRIEMITVFGTRWIPFDVEIAHCTDQSKGIGIHGAPMSYSADHGRLEEDVSSIGTFASDGCIRLRRQDVEELFSVISSRMTYVELISDFRESSLLKGQLQGSHVVSEK